MEIKSVKLDFDEGMNIILGQSHFIKTVEDIAEVMVNSVPGVKFGLAFNEASGPCLIRHFGTDKELTDTAIRNIEKIGAGHAFIVVIKDAFPINFLNGIKDCREVVNIFCATANPVEVIIAQTEQGRGVLGVVDGFSPRGVETEDEQKNRYRFLRTIGYKFGE